MATATGPEGTQTFSYAAGSTTVTIGDKAWIFKYNTTTLELSEIDSPAPTAGALALVTKFTYTNGDLSTVVHSQGAMITRSVTYL